MPTPIAPSKTLKLSVTVRPYRNSAPLSAILSSQASSLGADTEETVRQPSLETSCLLVHLYWYIYIYLLVHFYWYLYIYLLVHFVTGAVPLSAVPLQPGVQPGGSAPEGPAERARAVRKAGPCSGPGGALRQDTGACADAGAAVTGPVEGGCWRRVW
jgi:hypothetical protein